MALDFPSPATTNQLFSAAGATWRYDGTKWAVSGQPQGATAFVGDSPPTNPPVGALWWDSTGAQMYLWYYDGSSSQWTPVVNQMGANIGEAPTDGLTYGRQGSTATWSAAVPLAGVTTGTNATAGTVGELLSGSQTAAVSLATNATANIVTLALTPGDWKVYGMANFTPSAAATAMGVGISSTSATLPTAAQAAAGTGSLTQMRLAFTSAQVQSFQAGVARVNIGTGANVYLVAQATFASGTCTATGYIAARRMR